MAKRKRRAFTKEFKAQAVRIVRESGKPVGTVARELDLTETALRAECGRRRSTPAGGGGRPDHGRVGRVGAAVPRPLTSEGRHRRHTPRASRGYSPRVGGIALFLSTFQLREENILISSKELRRVVRNTDGMSGEHPEIGLRWSSGPVTIQVHWDGNLGLKNSTRL
jgi:transposase-like protein